MAATTLSIVIPAYQAEATICRTINSVLAWNLCELELIVVDDGSTDNTASLVSMIAASDSRLRLISQPNGGRSSARNRGVREATGAAVMFLDADDFLLEPAFPLLEKALDSPC